MATTNEDYRRFDTQGGFAVRRDDGAYAEFLSSAEADEVCRRLNAGEANEADYYWSVIFAN